MGSSRVALREWCSRNITTASISKILLSEHPVLFFARSFSFKLALEFSLLVSYLPTDFGVLGLQGLGRRTAEELPVEDLLSLPSPQLLRTILISFPLNGCLIVFFS